MSAVSVCVCVLALVSVCSALICPDGGMCKDGDTCCQTPFGGYGCCPLPNAECCSDHLHCCFQGTLCDLVHSKCVNKTVSLPLVKRRPATPPTPTVPWEEVRAVICPDMESECPDGTTCCQLLDGSWGCCPLAKAVCCEDRRHCCPENTKCDLKHSKCISDTLGAMPMWRKFRAHKRTRSSDLSIGSITCPGAKSACPDGFTCCLMKSGVYGCCPYPGAVCCSDQIHCCPNGTTCDLEQKKCASSHTQTDTPLAPKQPALLIQEPVVQDVICPDKISKCPDETTCCVLGNGSYGCCPMPKAVCCSDHMHCCPEGTTCDLAHSACVSANGRVAWATKIPAVTLPQIRAAAVACNDSVACADGSTCCKTASGVWACCPLEEAVCCPDHLHCCPHGTVCNLRASTCDDPADPLTSVPWLEKTPAFPLETEKRTQAPPNQKCDETSTCPDDYTCCKTAGGEWGCCPLPMAVCCEDHQHCCPHDTVCNLAASTCDDPADPLTSVPWLEKTPAFPLETEKRTQAPPNQKCDETSTCPDDYTCCKTAGGEWGCCPLPMAVCCEDHQHCCPHDTVCNLAASTCDSASGPLPMVRKVPALSASADASLRAPAPSPSHRLMCDAHTSCPDDNTCCFMHKAGRWGCCPLRQAVCCSTGEHCCPSGFTCDEKHTSCTKGRLEIPWFRKQEAKVALGSQGSEVREGVTDVKCDNKSSCALGSTCCQLPTGEWGCCPLVKAVCCTDHEHCCPQGYTCKLESGTCVKPSGQAASVPLLPLSESQQPSQDVQCDTETRCETDQTCCRTSPNSWACCPYKRAVCCPDMKNCCPMGYTCNSEVQGCTKRSKLTWWDNKL